MLPITEIHYRGFKGLQHQTIKLDAVNVLTGINNVGKSTALSAIRLLDVALRFAKRRSPAQLMTPMGSRLGYVIPTDSLSTSLENVHTDLMDIDTTVEVVLAGGGRVVLWFPPAGGLIFFVADGLATPRTPAGFKAAIPLEVVQVPILGPLEHDEPLVQPETVRNGLSSHRASRHFRTYWHHNPEGFGAFADLVARTWPGMQVEPPELTLGQAGGVVHMYCRERGATRELYWCGFGFQVWCQLLVHVSRARPGTVLVVDEPETYLHPIVQRQLLGIMRGTGAQIVLATHSATLIASALPGEVVSVCRDDRVAGRHASSGAQLCFELGLLPIGGPGDPPSEGGTPAARRAGGQVVDTAQRDPIPMARARSAPGSTWPCTECGNIQDEGHARTCALGRPESAR